jgi:hypothetical protein
MQRSDMKAHLLRETQLQQEKKTTGAAHKQIQ